MSRILVTDGDQRSTLAVVRSLGTAGHHVVVCSATGRSLAGASRHCREEHAVADPASDRAAFVAGVGGLIDSVGIDVVLPMTDVSASLLLDARGDLRNVRLPLPQKETWHLVTHKERLLRIASDLGVPVPRQVVLHSTADRGLAARAPDELGFPLVLKPARSAVPAGQGMRKLGVAVAGSAADLEARLASYPTEAYPLLVQEHISGPGVGAFMLCDNGRVLAAFGHKRLREKPPTGGVSVYRESVPLAPDVKRHAEAILGHVSWTGVAMVEFKGDPVRGVPYLMEVNGRLWGSLQLAIDAGVDFPRLLVDMAMGREVAPVTSYRVGRRSRWLWGDFDHLLWLLRAGPQERAADRTLPGRLRALARFALPWRPGDRWEVLRVNDPLPFARETINWFRSLGS